MTKKLCLALGILLFLPAAPAESFSGSDSLSKIFSRFQEYLSAQTESLDATKSTPLNPTTRQPASPVPPNIPNGNGDGGGIAGSGLAGYLAKWTSSSSLGNSRIFDNGINIGIGTASPSELLHVVKNSDLKVKFQNTAGQTGANVRLLFSTSNNLTNDTVGAIVKATRTDSNGSGSTDLVFGTSQGTDMSERMRLTSDGKLGIGTDTPTAKLDITGQIKIRGGGPDVGRVLTSDGTGLASWQPAAGGASLPAGTAGQTLRHNGTDWVANSLIYNSGANVGIGTTNPDAKLNVVGNTSIDSGFLAVSRTSTGNDAVLNVRQAGTGLIAEFGTAANNNLVNIDASGNIGIGTTEPTQKLEVAGALKLQSVGLPACNAATRGTMVFRAGSGSADDHLYFCMRRNGVFNWFGGD